MASVNPAVQIVLAMFGAAVGTLSILIAWKREALSSLMMTRVQLVSHGTVRDFQLLTLGHAVMFLGYLLYLTGVVLSEPALYDVGRYIGMVYGTIVLAVFYRWWRR